jgi:hypothetical protein
MAQHRKIEKRSHADLEFFWWEIRPEDEKGVAWGQLNGAAWRLLELMEDFKRVTRTRDAEAKVRRLTFAYENYLYRIYELRERVLNALKITTGQSKLIDQLRHPTKRELAIQTLATGTPRLADLTKQLLALLDSNIAFRNKHTHEQFLSCGLFSGQTFVEIDFQNIEPGTESAMQFKLLVLSGVREFRRRYVRRLQQVFQLTRELCDEVDPRRSAGLSSP